MKLNLPTTENLAPVTESFVKLKAEDKRRPTLVESERVLRLLYRTVSVYDKHYPAMLSSEARNVVLALHGTLVRHSLVEQAVQLEIAQDSLRKCRIEVTAHARIVHAMAEVERFLVFEAIAKR